jgi:aldoxime dehydratase
MSPQKPEPSRPPLESAVPSHLSGPNFTPKHAPGTFTPPYPSFSARFDESVQAVVMAYFGVQVKSTEDPRLGAALDAVANSFDKCGGPGYWDRARYTDSEGYLTFISVAYWEDPEEFRNWFADHGAWWVDSDHAADGIGFFLELVTPTADRFETILSANDATEGVAGLAPRLSGLIEEHTYWGSARDRLPLSQNEPLYPSGEPSLTEDGPVRTVVLHHNACLIRSGEDLTDAGDEERSFYQREVEPSLREGMDFLRDEGASIGCYDNRFMTVVDANNQPVSRTFGMSWWRDFTALEDWAASHPTHLKIFGSGMRHLSGFGPETRLRLYHEITVPAEQEQRFIYVGCHDRTGLLRAVV